MPAHRPGVIAKTGVRVPGLLVGSQTFVGKTQIEPGIRVGGVQFDRVNVELPGALEILTIKGNVRAGAQSRQVVGIICEAARQGLLRTQPGALLQNANPATADASDKKTTSAHSLPQTVHICKCDTLFQKCNSFTASTCRVIAERPGQMESHPEERSRGSSIATGKIRRIVCT